jgi:hypothetical protein
MMRAFVMGGIVSVAKGLAQATIPLAAKTEGGGLWAASEKEDTDA